MSDRALGRRTLKATLAALIIVCAAFAHAGQRPGCAVCGMWLDMYKNTMHAVILTDGSRHGFCSIHCAVSFMDANEGKVARVEAADFLSGEMVDARKAVYLMDSDAPPVMAAVSRIAFSTKNRAMEFMKKHGGKIADFNTAVKEVRKDG